jgi:hypothetical protein
LTDIADEAGGVVPVELPLLPQPDTDSSVLMIAPTQRAFMKEQQFSFNMFRLAMNQARQ